MSNSQPSPEQLLALLESVIRDAPAFADDEALNDNALRWIGRAEALVEACGSAFGLVEFRKERALIGSLYFNRSKLLAPLHAAYSRAELAAPAASQGAFIPSGDTWNGYAALIKLIQRECDDLLIIDPYIDTSLYTDFAPHVTARKGTRVLTEKRSQYHPALLAASGRWAADPISSSKLLETRYAPAHTLHDRLIMIDGEAWIVTQSFKDIAKRSPASVSKADAELSEAKYRHYDGLWGQSVPVT